MAQVGEQVDGAVGERQALRRRTGHESLTQWSRRIAEMIALVETGPREPIVGRESRHGHLRLDIVDVDHGHEELIRERVRCRPKTPMP